MILANIQWIDRQPLVSAIESSIVSPSGCACAVCRREASVLQQGISGRYDSIAHGFCQNVLVRGRRPAEERASGSKTVERVRVHQRWPMGELLETIGRHRCFVRGEFSETGHA